LIQFLIKACHPTIRMIATPSRNDEHQLSPKISNLIILVAKLDILMLL